MHRLEVGKPDCLLRRLIYRLSERPAAAQTSVVDGPYIGFSVRPAADVMTPGMNACDAGVEAFDRRKPGARIHVVGRHRAAEAGNRWEEAVLALVAGHVAEQGVPHMPVGIDKTGKPIRFRPSITSAPGAFVLAPTATIAPLRTCTSRSEHRRAAGPS